MDIFVIYVLCLSCFLVCLLPPFGHMMGKDGLSARLCVMFSCISFTFQCGVLSQMWYFIASTPDLCLLPYFVYKPEKHTCCFSSFLMSSSSFLSS